MTDLLVLAHLLPGPQHGYALKKQVGLITGYGELHNNLIYPLLRRFQTNGWISRRTAPGQRGQTREVYALTQKGRQELLRRLGQFTGKDVASEDSFRLRVGLFAILDRETRGRILAEREAWLAHREERVAHLTRTLKVDRWSSEVLQFFAKQIRLERTWISRLKRKV